jgi:hypothetical protein
LQRVRHGLVRGHRLASREKRAMASSSRIFCTS